jgi:hypothetical protein
MFTNSLILFIRLQKKESSLQSNDEKFVDKSNMKTKIPKFDIFSSKDTTLRSPSKSPSTIIKTYGKTTTQSMIQSTTQPTTRLTRPTASYIFIKCYHLFSII